MKKIRKNQTVFVHSLKNDDNKNNKLLSLLPTILKIIPKINLAETQKAQPNKNFQTPKKENTTISQNQKCAINYLEAHRQKINNIKNKTK
ncbi:MAG: hypothetical protein IJ837_03140 [Clostridia bacterium]|nr:hypothetical protein [Clostridia bacterium]